MGLCLEITASPAQTLQIAPLAKEEYIAGGTLNLNWKDCGDSTYHAKITNLSPSQLILGQSTHHCQGWAHQRELQTRLVFWENLQLATWFGLSGLGWIDMPCGPRRSQYWCGH